MAFTIVIATVLLLSDVFAFHAPLIGGKWWQRPAVKENLHLTPDQASKINTIWMEYKKRIIDLKGNLEKVYLDLENLMNQPTVNKESAYPLAERIAELQEHHECRLNEVVAALEKGEMTAWDIASHLSWDISVSSLDLFPFIQKWFALGETIAHIIYLEAEGRVKRKEKDNRILYFL